MKKIFFLLALTAFSACSPRPVAEPKWIAMEALDTLIIPGREDVRNCSTEWNQYKMPQFRREFRASGGIATATASVCGLGHFELYVNGEKAGDHFLDPGWTDYAKEALYVDFDVTEMLKKGDNVIDVMLGNGFYNVPRTRYVKLVGSFGQPKLRMSLDIKYKNGRHQTIVTDCENWKVSESPITFSSIYGGESYDARRESQLSWTSPVEAPTDIELRPQDGTELKVFCEIPEKSHFKCESGEWIYDLGQNFSGIVRLSVKGSAGQTVEMWPGELLNEHSDITQGHSGTPYHWDYTLKGSEEGEVWQPRFTYYGQRYIRVVGAVPAGEDNPDGLPVVSEMTGLHTCLAAEEVGSFECGEDLFNRIHTLIDWAIRSNSQSVLTDCPHRERLGWLEQAHLMQGSLLYRYDYHKLFKKTLQDMESAQWDNGCIPTIAPMYVLFANGFEDTPEWGSAFIISAWQAYRWYGDTDLFANHYPAMKSYIEYLDTRADDGIVAYGLGDWYDIGPGFPGVAQLTSNGLTATAIYYYDTLILSKMAEVLGNKEDAAYYLQHSENIRAAFNRTFYHADRGYYDRNSQTANAMPLYVGLVEEQNRGKVLQSLIDEISGRNYALTAGDVGYRFVVQTLQDAGRGDVIYKMNCRSDVPGYGWQLAHGATALTESWQAYSDVSNNHFMLGHLMEWLYGGLGGIRQTDESVAFRHILISPDIIPEVGYAKASLKIEGGTISSYWKLDGDDLTVEVTIPEGSDARVLIPAYGLDVPLTSGSHHLLGHLAR